MLSGRLQSDAVWVDENSYDDSTWRRFRFGFKAHLSQQFMFHLEADFDLNNEAEYRSLTDAYFGFSLSNGAKFKVLKQSAGFTLDGNTSSKKLLTTERNNLTNNLWFTNEYYTGLSYSNTFDDKINYKAAVYANDGAEEISDFDAGYFTLFSVTYKDVQTSWWDAASYTLDYVYNDEDDGADTRDFEHIVSISSVFDKNNWQVATDFAIGKGFSNQSNVTGVVIMPSYDFSNHTQLVARYTYINSNGDNGVRLNRYENRAIEGRGDKYHELYTGLNYYLNQHKLKLQLGLQYANMKDEALDGGKFAGWSATTGVRLYW